MRTLIGGNFMYNPGNYGNFTGPVYPDYNPDLRQRLNNMQMQQNMRQQPMPQPYVQPYTPPQPVQQPAPVIFGTDPNHFSLVNCVPNTVYSAAPATPTT